MNDLFDTTPLPRGPQARAATADPATSHIAAREVEASGAAQGQRDKVRELVTRYPDSTAMELASMSSLNQFQVARRLPELQRAGLVARGESRKCNIKGTMMTTWRVV